MLNRADELEQTALAAVNVGAWAWDMEADQITWSDGLYGMFGIDRAVRTRRVADIVQLIHPHGRSHFQAELERARTTALDWETTQRLDLPGPERWVRARGRVLRDAAGRAQRMLGIVEDVSVAHQLEAERNEHSTLMRTALDASLFAVVVLDTSGRIIYCNELAASLLGLTPSVVQARAYDAPQFKHTDVHGGPWADDDQPFVRVMRTGEPVHGVEHCIERPDGRVIALRINGAPIRNESGEIKLVVCSFEDITERRSIEVAFRQAQKMEAVGRLAGGIAHDFNNLLTVVLSYASLARGELKDDTALAEYLDGITEAGERASQLTRQLLAFGRREVSQAISFDARHEVEAATRLITRVVGPQVTLELDLEHAPCWVRMDPSHLQQVLLNLAINARDAMPDGGQLRISVKRTDHRSVLLSVSDTGNGMDAETMRKAFEPFFTTKAAHEGTGLGLSTCHGIVVQAGGRIELFSELQRGTRVEIELPLVAAAEPQSATPTSSTAAHTRSGRILIVEDDPAVQRIAARTLERAGYQVHTAAQASQALETLELQPAIDLIVCDMVLPGMSGPDLIQRIRQQRPGMRVLFVSGYSNELARTGSDHFLGKPYAPEALRRSVAEALMEREPALQSRRSAAAIGAK